ncbi:hypothetical protein [Terrilactibacillus laevilacticus]|uniref:Uncharacterized protein n=1 Tax=Terrilactibacillus laevilacticus TaxID=1380157 RepID=A0ABW5PU81_9BACI|nr:hypothetical protein [Terrilactibacillus laevilacticus]
MESFNSQSRANMAKDSLYGHFVWDRTGLNTKDQQCSYHSDKLTGGAGKTTTL